MTRYCPRCDEETEWASRDGGIVNYCPCGFHLGVEMSGVEQFRFDRHTANVQREHVFEQPPSRRRNYEWV